ncbi:MAG: hypothetical protein GY950_09340, partial [bacterium]|nr:hypothetical protein [bacterium]
VIGLILIGVYFFLVMSSPLTELLRPGETREKILSAAQSFFQKLPVNHDEFDRSINIGKDQTLLDYAQYYKKKHGRYPLVVPGYHTVTWTAKESGSPAPEDREKRTGRRYFQIKYDFSGNLLGFWDNTRGPGLLDVIGEISEEDALFEAKYFLGEYGIKTESLKVAKREISKKAGNIQHKFVLEGGSQ